MVGCQVDFFLAHHKLRPSVGPIVGLISGIFGSWSCL